MSLQSLIIYFKKTSLKWVIFLMFFQSSLVFANSQLRCQQLFNSSVSSLKGSQFLHERNSQFHTSAFVNSSIKKLYNNKEINSHKPVDKINLAMKRVEHLLNKAQSDSKNLERLKEILYNQFVIKPDQVPESYFEAQVKLHRERGGGDVILSDLQKSILVDVIIVDQKRSLDLWIDYFVSKDSQMYPIWFKYWVLTEVPKLSKYGRNTNSFGNRSKETVAPFPELNYEALSYVWDVISLRLSGKKVVDEELAKLVQGAQFKKTYSKAFSQVGVQSKGAFKTEKGQWVIYPMGSDHMPLVNSLQGHNTGWCTAGEATAFSQLSRGDFHVYYSLDSDGAPTIPRIAIRMEQTEIGEVRGVAESQNLDAQISKSKVLSKKMKEFGSKAQVYEKKDSHMRLLTLIEEKHRSRQELSKEELLFLYELREPIVGFGQTVDKRIAEIISQRDIHSDIANALNIKKEEVTFTQEDFLKGKSKVHIGDLDLSHLTHANGLKLPRFLIGNLNLSKLVSVNGLKLPESVLGSVNLKSVTYIENFKFSKFIKNDLLLDSLVAAKGLYLPETVREIRLDKLKSAEGIRWPKNVERMSLYELISAKGLVLPDIMVALSMNKLESEIGLVLPKEIKGYLVLGGFEQAPGLRLPEVIGGNLVMPDLIYATGIIFPKVIQGNLRLLKLKSFQGSKMPEVVNGYLELYSLENKIDYVEPEGAKSLSDW